MKKIDSDFNNWINETEIYGSRFERMHEELNPTNDEAISNRLDAWLKAAFEQGYEAGKEDGYEEGHYDGYREGELFANHNPI